MIAPFVAKIKPRMCGYRKTKIVNNGPERGLFHEKVCHMVTEDMLDSVAKFIDSVTSRIEKGGGITSNAIRLS